MVGKLFLRRQEPEVRCFTRDSGPLCYEVNLFDPERLDRTRRALEESALSWWWGSETRSTRVEPARQRRPPTLLTADRMESLMDDVRWRDENGYGRFVALYALDPDRGREQIAPSLDEWVRSFAEREAGPLRAVILQVGDSTVDHAYVPHDPDPRVRAFLESIGPPLDDYETVPYRKLHTASLEAQLGVE